MILTIVHIVALLILSFLIGKRVDISMRKFFWPALMLKVISGLALGLLYVHYYSGGDTISYFEDASTISGMAHQDVGEYFRFLLKGDNTFDVWSKLHYTEPRALFLSKITSVFTWATGNSYSVTSIYFSFLSFLGSWHAVRFIARQYPKVKQQLVFALLFFPSVVFWTSGLVKESISMAALCFLVVLFLKVYQRVRFSWWEWLLLPVALWMLWNLKYYYVAVLLPVALTAIAMKWLVFPYVKVKSTVAYAAIWMIVFAIPVFVVSRVHPNFYPEYFLEVIANSYAQFAAKSDPGDIVLFNDLNATPSSIASHAPKALFSGLFRPFLWEVQNKLQFVAAIENTIILLLSIFALANLRRLIQSPERLLLFSMIIYVASLGVFLTLSTPNYGTLVRYRVGFLPFYILLVTIENRLFNISITFLETVFSGLVRKRT